MLNYEWRRLCTNRLATKKIGYFVLRVQQQFQTAKKDARLFVRRTLSVPPSGGGAGPEEMHVCVWKGCSTTNSSKHQATSSSERKTKTKHNHHHQRGSGAHQHQGYLPHWHQNNQQQQQHHHHHNWLLSPCYGTTGLGYTRWL